MAILGRLARQRTWLSETLYGSVLIGVSGTWLPVLLPVCWALAAMKHPLSTISMLQVCLKKASSAQMDINCSILYVYFHLAAKLSRNKDHCTDACDIWKSVASFLTSFRSAQLWFQLGGCFRSIILNRFNTAGRYMTVEWISRHRIFHRPIRVTAASCTRIHD